MAKARKRSRKKTPSTAEGGAAGTGAAPPGSAVDELRLPRWLAPALLAVVTLLLFREFVFSDRMLLGNDTLSLGYMAREFYAEALRGDGAFPLWNPMLLGGIPFLDALAAGDSLYPTALLLLVMEPYRALGWKLVLHVFVGGLAMTGWVRALGASRPAALLAGLAFAVAPFFVTLVYPGHDGKLFVTALTPLLFWSMERTFQRPGVRPYLIVSLVVALVILTTHFQLAYFLFGAAGLYYAVRCVWPGDVAGSSPPLEAERSPDRPPERPSDRPGRGWTAGLSRFGLFLAASITGAAVAGVQLLPAVGYVTEFSRRTATTTEATPAQNRAYASSWSLHPEEVVSLVVPEFPGNDSGGADWTRGSYWGRNQVRDNHSYAGLAVLLLALASFFGGTRRSVRRFFAALGVGAILYALGTHTPVWGIAYAVLPGIDLFRAPDMVAFLFGFSVITLAALGIDRVLGLGGGEEEGDRALVKALGVGAGLIALGALLSATGLLFSGWVAVVYPDIGAELATLQAQEPFIVRGFFLATVIAGSVLGIAVARRRGVLTRLGVVAALGLLIFLDGFRISHSFVQTIDFRQWVQPDPLVQELLARQQTEPPFRVASFERAGQAVAPAIHGLELATGHHPNDLARYRELIGMEGSSMPMNLLELGEGTLLGWNLKLLSILNVRYVIWPDAEFGSFPESLPAVARSQLGGRIYQSLYEVPSLPRARLVTSWIVVPEEEAVAAILSPTFDPAQSVVLNEPPPLGAAGGESAGGEPVGDVVWEERANNVQRLRVRTDRAALLVLADNWYPAWRATVDGAEAPVLRANHTLRAVPVDAGEHLVEFTYESAVVRAGLRLSFAALLLLALVAIGSLLGGRRAAADDGG